jgi:hypothetical protein
MKSFKELLQVKDGIVFPNAKLAVGGGFALFHNAELVDVGYNLVTNEGLTDLLDVYLKGTSPAADWFVAPWSNNVTPASTWTAANFDSIAGEFTDYDESARPVWTPGEIADQTVSSILSAATFTINAGATIYGASLISASAKEATTGKLFSAFRFANSRTFEDGDTMSIAYFVAAQST